MLYFTPNVYLLSFCYQKLVRFIIVVYTRMNLKKSLLNALTTGAHRETEHRVVKFFIHKPIHTRHAG